MQSSQSPIPTPLLAGSHLCVCVSRSIALPGGTPNLISRMISCNCPVAPRRCKPLAVGGGGMEEVAT